jgi:acyl-CoA synthetase (AMP-forming)/AMP-acid ligase II
MTQSDYLFDPSRFAGRSVLKPWTAPGMLGRTVARCSARPAVIDGAVRLDWAEAGARANAFAAALQSRGIGKGDVVALYLPNSWEFPIAHWGIALAGAVTFPQHVPYREAELRAFLGHARAKAIVGGADAAARMTSLRADLPELQTVVVTGGASEDALGFEDLLGEFEGRTPAPVQLDPDDPYVLFSTSGTESLRPKVCMHGHAGFLSNAAEVASAAGVTERDVILSLSGFTHAFGIIAVHFAALHGASLVCQPRYEPTEFLRLVAGERVTMAWAVAAQLADITRAARERGVAGFATLREVRTGGAPISPALARDVRATLCGNFIIQWGMSEIGCGLVTRYGDPPEATATLGRPLDGGEIAFADGELLYRRACMFRGYYRDPATTQAALTSDGWMRTGDLASLDAGGRVVYRGRSKDVINRGGMKVSAFELEALLATMPAIRQLAVVGTPDERLGDRACLVCSLHDGATLELDDVTAFLAERDVAKYKWPEMLLVLDRLPATPTGKVAKQAVRELVAARAVNA